ncbi:hypothetical protein NC796_07630 [Aliifodinibius sp. S!AR15-10]|uniref:hypothetical protein n=1 Tax=Aliifodinibius sp. S!AR15-10 TaxID=2950437 RepID=UPI00286297C1|nr:hypothetical protein [Aliifodinibius sp. S!AR15-10]MDR8391002.1 hypothetical protein [Aliifodinibius sp. S!AR15-10]
MAYKSKYHIINKTHINGNFTTFRVELLERNYGGSSTLKNGDGGKPFKFSYNGADVKKIWDNPIQKGELVLNLMIEELSDVTILDDIFNSDEKKYRLRLKQDGNIKWTGYVIPDLIDYNEGPFPFAASITAKDLHLLESNDAPTNSDISYNKYITGISNLLNNSTELNLDIVSYNDWSANNLSDTDDYFNQVYYDEFQNQDFSSFSNGTFEPITELEALKNILPPGFVLRQWNNQWNIYDLSHLAKDNASVEKFQYDYTGSLVASSSNVDLTVDVDKDKRFLLGTSKNKPYPAVKKLELEYNHKTAIQNLLFEPEYSVFVSSVFPEEKMRIEQASESIVRVEGEVQIQTTQSGFVTASADILVSVGDHQMDINDGTWGSNQGNSSINVSGFGPGYISQSFQQRSKNIPETVSGSQFTVQMQYGSVEGGENPDEVKWVDMSSYYINGDAVSDGASRNLRLKRTGNYTYNAELEKIIFGEGPDRGIDSLSNSAIRYLTGGNHRTLTDFKHVGGTGVSYEEFVMTNIMNMQRNSNKNLDADLLALFQPTDVLTYRSNNHFLLNGTLSGKDSKWRGDLIRLQWATASNDTFSEYVKIGENDAGSTVGSSTSTVSGIDQEEADNRYFNESENLSEGDPVTMRSNLDVYSTVESNDRFLQIANELSEITNVSGSKTFDSSVTIQQYLDMDSDGRVQGDGSGAIEILADDGTNKGILRVDKAIINDLEVSGSIDNTITNELHVEDQYIAVNASQSGTPTLDGGIYAERGSSNDAYLFWDEGNDKWGQKLGISGSFDRIIFASEIFPNGNNQALGTSSNVEFNNIVANGYIDVGLFPEGSLPAHKEGRLFYQSDENALSYYNDQSEVTINIGQESVLRAKNVEGSSISNGDVVYVSGSSGDNPEIRLARADSIDTVDSTIGLVTQNNINNNGVGYITTFGRVRGLDTSAFSAGDEVFISTTTAGGITNVEPSYPNFVWKIGYVIRSHASEGIIFVDVEQQNDVYQQDSILFANGDGRAAENNDRLTWDNTNFIFDISGSLNVSDLLTINGTQLFTLGQEQALGTGDSPTFAGGTFNGVVNISGGNLDFDINGNDKIRYPRHILLREAAWDAGDYFDWRVAGAPGSEGIRVYWHDDSVPSDTEIFRLDKSGNITQINQLTAGGLLTAQAGMTSNGQITINADTTPALNIVGGGSVPTTAKIRLSVGATGVSDAPGILLLNEDNSASDESFLTNRDDDAFTFEYPEGTVLAEIKSGSGDFNVTSGDIDIQSGQIQTQVGQLTDIYFMDQPVRTSDDVEFNKMLLNTATSFDSPTSGSQLQIGDDGDGNDHWLTLGRSGVATSGIEWVRVGTVDARIFMDSGEDLNITNDFGHRIFLTGMSGVGIGIQDHQGYTLNVNGTSQFKDDATYLQKLTDDVFNSGFGGTGWRIDENADAEFQDLTVRGTFNVYELLIHQIRATNGSVLIANSGKVSGSSNIAGSQYYLTFDTGSSYGHSFQQNDIALAQRFDADSNSLHQSFIQVDSVVNNGAVSASLLSGSVPSAGFEYVRLGNTSDTDRQGHIYLTADDSNSPFIGVRDGMDAVADFTNGTGSIEKVRVGRLDGITSPEFGALDGYGLWASGSVYLEGGIAATFGNIGGFGISDTAISSSNNELIMRSNGQITGSNVLFDGGKIGGFTINSEKLERTGTGTRVSIGNDLNDEWSSGDDVAITGFFNNETRPFIGVQNSGGSHVYMNIESGNPYLNSKDNNNNNEVQIGELTGTGHSGQYGIYISSGSTEVFHVHGGGAEIAGWTFDNTSLSAGNLTLSSSGQIINSTQLDSTNAYQFDNDGSGNLAGKKIRWNSDGLLRIQGAIQSRATEYDIAEQGSMYALSRRVVPRDGLMDYAIFEDNTKIWVNGELTESGSAGDNGTLNLVQGDLIDVNKPVNIIHSRADSIPSEVYSGKLFGVHLDRDGPHTFYLVSFQGEANVSASISQDFSDGTNFTVQETDEDTNNVYTLDETNDGYGAGVGLDANGDTYYIKSDKPISIFKQSGTSDQMLLAPMSKEVLIHDISYINKIGSATVNTVSGVYAYSDEPFSVNHFADGAGTNAEQGVPYEMCGDTYGVHHPVADYIIVAIEPCEVTVTNDNGVWATHDLTAASRDNPVIITTGSDAGGGTAFDSGATGWKFTGTGKFYIRTNDNTDEYSVLGYDSRKRNRDGQTLIRGGFVRTGRIESENWDGTSGTRFDLNSGSLQMGYGGNTVFDFNAASSTAQIAGWTFEANKLERTGTGTRVSIGNDLNDEWSSGDDVAITGFFNNETRPFIGVQNSGGSHVYMNIESGNPYLNSKDNNNNNEVQIGELTGTGHSGQYGIYISSGSTEVFHVHGGGAEIAGWTFSDKRINKSITGGSINILSDGTAFSPANYDTKPVINVFDTSNNFLAEFGNIYGRSTHSGFAVRTGLSTGSIVFEMSSDGTSNVQQIAGFDFDADTLKKTIGGQEIAMGNSDAYTTSFNGFSVGNSTDNRIVMGELNGDYELRGPTISGNPIFQMGSVTNQIAGWTFEDDKFYGGNTTGEYTGMQPGAGSTKAFFAGADDKSGTNADFYAEADGTVKLTSFFSNRVTIPDDDYVQIADGIGAIAMVFAQYEQYGASFGLRLQPLGLNHLENFDAGNRWEGDNITGEPTGTSGTDGQATIFYNADNDVFIENRSGASADFFWYFAGTLT